MGHFFSRAHAAQRNLRGQRLLLLFGQHGRHVGGNKARGHAIDRHAPAGQLARQRARHARHARLGCRVVGLAGVARGAHHAGDIDDAPIALLHHGPHHGAAHAKDGREIGFQHRVPVFVFHAHGQRVARDAGVVHQHMQRAALNQYDKVGVKITDDSNYLKDKNGELYQSLTDYSYIYNKDGKLQEIRDNVFSSGTIKYSYEFEDGLYVETAELIT